MAFSSKAQKYAVYSGAAATTVTWALHNLKYLKEKKSYQKQSDDGQTNYKIPPQKGIVTKSIVAGLASGIIGCIIGSASEYQENVTKEQMEQLTPFMSHMGIEMDTTHIEQHSELYPILHNLYTLGFPVCPEIMTTCVYGAEFVLRTFAYMQSNDTLIGTDCIREMREQSRQCYDILKIVSNLFINRLKFRDSFNHLDADGDNMAHFVDLARMYKIIIEKIIRAANVMRDSRIIQIRRQVREKEQHHAEFIQQNEMLHQSLTVHDTEIYAGKEFILTNGFEHIPYVALPYQ